MRTYIIKACAESEYKTYKKYMAAPSQSIFSLAATTPEGIDIGMCDETIDMKVDFKDKADIVAIFFSTPDAYRGYEIADRFRAIGKTVVLGGLHVKFNEIEALVHADSLLIGECEGIWEELLEDYESNQLKMRYERQDPVDLDTLNDYPTNLIDLERYSYVWSVLVSRGCRNRCGFCLVHKFSENFRYRKIEHIVNEIKRSKAKIVELHSDHLIADREYAKELFEALIPLKIFWVGETTIDIADDDELLDLAARSGLKYLLVGLETPNREALRYQGKGFVKPEKVKDQIRKLHQRDIIVDSGILFGLKGHTRKIFDECIDYVNDIDLDIPHGIIPIPFPGSTLYQNLEAEGKILTNDWSKYDGRHLVFEHDELTEKEIIEGIKQFEYKVFDLRRVVRYYKMLAKLGIKAMT